MAASWTTALLGNSVGAATATDSMVVVWLPDEHLVAFDRLTGTETWRRELPRDDDVVFLHPSGSSVVVDSRNQDNVATWADIDPTGRERLATTIDQSTSPLPQVRPDGLYQTNLYKNGLTTRALFDPATGTTLDVVTGVALDETWGDLVLVEADGSVVVRHGLDGQLEPTGVVLDHPAHMDVVLVADQIVTYQDDELRSYALDGTFVWRADYEGDWLSTVLVPVGPNSSRLAVVTHPDRIDIIDVASQSVVLSTTMKGAAFPNQWPDRMVASVQPMGDGTVGLLDFESGEVTANHTTTARLIADAAGAWLDLPATEANPHRLIGLDADGTASWIIELPPNDHYEPVPGGAVIVSDAEDGPAITFFDFPEP